MRKIFCDFCGKEVLESELWGVFLKRPDSYYEICQECSDRLNDITKNKKSFIKEANT